MPGKWLLILWDFPSVPEGESLWLRLAGTPFVPEALAFVALNLPAPQKLSEGWRKGRPFQEPLPGNKAPWQLLWAFVPADSGGWRASGFPPAFLGFLPGRPLQAVVDADPTAPWKRDLVTSSGRREGRHQHEASLTHTSVGRKQGRLGKEMPAGSAPSLAHPARRVPPGAGPGGRGRPPPSQGWETSLRQGAKRQRV